MNLTYLMETAGHEQFSVFTSPDGQCRAFVAIHETTLGPGMGGVRRWPYQSEELAVRDALRLSEAMTYKAAIADLPIGGAKAVIWCEPNTAPSPTEAYTFGRFIEKLAGRYIAAPDVGTNEKYMAWMGESTRYVAGEATERGGTGSPSPWTAVGVLAGIRACIRRLDGTESLAGKTVAVQGAGAVGGRLAELLAEAGAHVRLADVNTKRVYEIANRYPGMIVPISADDVVTCGCDVFAPCALGGVISEQVIPLMRCRIVAGSANNPLCNPSADAGMLADHDILYAPDFVINAGGVIHVGGSWLGWSRHDCQQRIEAIGQTLRGVFRQAGSNGNTHDEALRLARHRLLSAQTQTTNRRANVVATN